jgi:threonine dehydratase
MVSLDDIESARRSIQPFIHKTPLFHSRSLSEMTGAEVYIKAENLQKTGAFKVRGAFNRMARLEKGRVVAASMGNHAQAVAYAAACLGLRALIVMPRTVSILKEEATRGYGAEVELFGDSFEESLEHALSMPGWTFVHAFDDELIIAGQGTLGLEMVEEQPDLEVVLVPAGGGGLVAGTAVAIKERSPGVQVIGVQAEAALSATASFRRGFISADVPRQTIADGIAVGKVGAVTFPIIQRYVDDMLAVKEDDIALAVLLFMERNKFVVEGAGAVPLAALIENKERFRGKKVGLVASGGNIDFILIDRIIYKGLLTSGRILVFEVIADDVPGSLQALSGIVAEHRGNIVNVVHDRLQADLPIGKTRVIFIVETRARAHLEEILRDVEAKGYAVRTRTSRP